MKDHLPNVRGLLDLLLAIPATSADAERGFSRLNLLKTNLRTALLDDRVTDQLLVMLHAQDIATFNPEPCISLWLSGGTRSRRPDKNPQHDAERELQVMHEQPEDSSASDTDSEPELMELDSQ